MSHEPQHLSRLLQPGRIGPLVIPNRMVFPAMGTRYASDTGAVTDQMISYFARRAEGGVGLTIVQSTYVTPTRVAGGLGIFEDQFLMGLNNLAESIKDWGSRCAIQFQHQGAVLKGGKGPDQMEAPDFTEVLRLFAAAARRAATAGFEGIEIHLAHGYLMNQFLSPAFNHRSDGYGGSLENRLRFPLEVIESVRNAAGPDMAVWVRLSAEDKIPGGLTITDTVEIARTLERAGIDAIHVSCGGKPDTYEWVVQPMSFPRGVLIPYAQQIAEAVQIPVIAVGRINDPALGEQVLATTPIQFIAFGRGLIADPDLPRKVARNEVHRIRMCTACNYCHGKRTSEGLTMKCSVNAEVGREGIFQLRPTSHAKRVLVVGGGPGGMEAARILAERGHSPILYERGSELGGSGILSAIPPHKEEWRNLLAFQCAELKRLGVEVQLGRSVDRETVQALAPDAIILATGSKPLIPEPLMPLLGSRAFLAEDVLLERVAPVGRVIVAGAGYVGCEVAEWLAVRGFAVTMLVGRNERVAYNAEPLTRKGLIERLVALGVTLSPGLAVCGYGPESVRVRDRSGAERELPFDTIVLSVGMRANAELYDQLLDLGIPMRAVGDCVRPRGIAEAVYEGYVAAMQIS